MAKRKPNQDDDFNDDDTLLTPTNDDGDGDDRYAKIRELEAEVSRLKSVQHAGPPPQWYRVKHVFSPPAIGMATSAAEAIARYCTWAGILHTDKPPECTTLGEAIPEAMEKTARF